MRKPVKYNYRCKYILVLGCMLIFFSNCNTAEDIITSYGKEITVKRQIGSFSSMIAGEKFDIELRQDSTKEGELEMTAGENVIDGYVTEIKNGELMIENRNKFNLVRNLKVRQKVVVYFKTINKIQINGSAKFTCKDTIKQKVFSLSHDGLENAEFTVLINNLDFKGTNTGGVILKGRSYIFSVSVDNLSFLDSKGMRTDYCQRNCFNNISKSLLIL